MRLPQFVQAFLGFILLLLVGTGGWVLWTQRQQHVQTLQRLQQTQAALQQKDELLASVQEEQQHLSEAYDTLKARWTQSDQQVKTLTDAAARQAKDAEAAGQARATLEQQLQELHAAQAQVQQQLASLQKDLTAKAAESTALAQRLKETDKRALSHAELEQLAQMLEEGEQRQALLQQRILELSNAYDALAQAQPPAAAAGGKKTAIASAETPKPQNAEAAKRKAADWQRQLGEIYLAAYQFDRAADAFEQSVALYDDPNVHAQLAFLYSRFLHDQEKANQHVALAIGVEPATRTLDPMAHRRGLPRSDNRLVWKWLTQDDSPNAKDE